MDLDALGRNLNWVDWAVLATLALFTYGGLRRGLLLGSLDLLGLGVPLLAAYLLYQPAARWMLASIPFPLPEPVVHIAAFAAILFVSPVVYGIALSFVQRLLGPAFRGLESFQSVNAALGMAPGLAKGAVAASFVIVPLTVFPLMPDITKEIDRSIVATQLVQIVGRIAPVTQTRFLRPEDQTIPAMSPLPGMDSNPIPNIPLPGAGTNAGPNVTLPGLGANPIPDLPISPTRTPS